MQIIKDSIKTIIVSLIILSLATVAYAWTEPASNPPAGNASAPINTSSTPQYKSGSFGVTTPGGYAQTLLQQWGLYSPGTMYIEPGPGSNLYLTDQWNKTGMLNIQFGKTIFESGNVGIGVDPWAKLDVAGNIKSSTSVTANGLGEAYGGAGGMNANYYHSATNDSWFSYPGNNYNYIRGNTFIGNDTGIITTVGNVGIGTTAPEAKLDVRGVVSTTGNFYLKTYYNLFFGNSLNANRIIFNNSGNGGDTGASINSYYWYSPSQSGWIPKPEARGMGLVFSTGQAVRSLWSSSWSSGAPVERMRITADGKVGIGTTMPQATLDINGTIRGATYGFGGMFVESWEGDYSGYSSGTCYRVNPFTGSCSCPSGFSKSQGLWNGKYSGSADFYCYK